MDATLDYQLRIDQIIGNPRKGVTGLVPMSRTTFYELIKRGVLPAPRKLGGRTSYWSRHEVLSALARMSGGEK